jgi:adenylate cyclase
MRLSTLFSLILAGVLLVTAGCIGWLGYSTSHRVTKGLTQRVFALADASAAHEVVDFLDDPANRLLEEYVLLARRGMLPLKDDRALAFDFAERLRVNNTLAWISYSDAATGHFVGVWRDAKNNVVRNVDDPGRPQAREAVITPEGREIPYDRPQGGNYDPRRRDWFKSAVHSEGTVWSPPYLFFEGNPGITASRAWRPAEGAPPAGVFTVDFYLNDLQALIQAVADRVNGVCLIVDPEGNLVTSSSDPQATDIAAAVGAWVRAHPDFKDINGRDSSRLEPITVGGAAYLAAFDHVHAATGLRMIVAALVPRSVLYERLRQTARQMAEIGAVGLALAVLAGAFMAYRISRPLQVLEQDLARVGRFYLDAEKTPRSIIIEVNELRDAADRMKSGLRSFIKYVPGDLVRQLLATGQEAVLGGELRRLTVFFSDIAGFAAHSEHVPPAAPAIRHDRQIHRGRPARLFQCAPADLRARETGLPRRAARVGGTRAAAAGKERAAIPHPRRPAWRRGARRQHRHARTFRLHRARRCGQHRQPPRKPEQGLRHPNPGQRRDLRQLGRRL